MRATTQATYIKDRVIGISVGAHTQFISTLIRQNTGQNQVKLFKLLNIIPEIIPWSVQENDSNFEKSARGDSHVMSWSPLTFSEEIQVGKELVLQIVRL